MSKWFEIAVTTYRTFAVEVQDDETGEDAMTAVMDELGFGGDHEARIECEVTDPLVLEALQRTADEVLEL